MIECVHTLCYTATKGGDNMAKTNSDIVKAYHNKLSEIKVRFPSKDKGEGSANAYILHLIEKDLGIEVKSISKIEK